MIKPIVKDICMVKVKCMDRHNDKHHVEIEQLQLSRCRVCGYDFVDWFPWGERGVDPTFGICPSCGVEFGYEDSSVEGILSYRQRWIARGAPWDKPEEKPNDWNLEKAMEGIPDAFK